jgi:hypothetical protein
MHKTMLEIMTGQYKGYYQDPETGDRYYKSKEKDASGQRILKKVKKPMSEEGRAARRKPKSETGMLAILEKHRERLANVMAGLEKDIQRLSQ